jgi:hypothetical protein
VTTVDGSILVGHIDEDAKWHREDVCQWGEEQVAHELAIQMADFQADWQPRHRKFARLTMIMSLGLPPVRQ